MSTSHGKKTSRRATLVTVLVAAALAPSSGCSKSSTCGANPAGYAPVISPVDFPTSMQIDNKYFALVPGTVFVFAENTGNVTEITVGSDKKTILGIDCVVVHDVVKTATGDLVEDTFDWFAQDKDGNVWYFGESTKAYQAGKSVSTAGSWEGGVNCALPGITMKASPRVGETYRQEYLAGVAEDKADVVSLTESITVPYGSFDNCLMTKDYTDLEPGAFEHKYFCPGVGQVSSVDVMPAEGKHEDLTSVNGNHGDGGAGDGGVGDAGGGG